jgi:toxin ParE1/3/4
MTYDFHPEARLEYREAAAFYESRRPGLGAAFTVEVEDTIGRILEAPERLRREVALITA